MFYIVPSIGIGMHTSGANVVVVVVAVSSSTTSLVVLYTPVILS
jgi:hypothetical protein